MKGVLSITNTERPLIENPLFSGEKCGKIKCASSCAISTVFISVTVAILFPGHGSSHIPSRFFVADWVCKKCSRRAFLYTTMDSV